MKRILLYDLEQPSLIAEHHSGVVYTNQVGGLLCFQAELEGVLIPLPFDIAMRQKLENLSYPQGVRGINSDFADRIDEILRDSGTNFLKVDRDRLEDSWEAWIHVKIVDSPDIYRVRTDDPHTIYGFGESSGVLTWSNSD